MKRRVFKIIFAVVAAAVILVVYKNAGNYFNEKRVLKAIISRLNADSRTAEVLVTGVNYDEEKGKTYTTIKFLEYGTDGKALDPRYFTFSGNIIQFQSLVVRFGDSYVEWGDKVKGKSLYLFWKVFMLDGKQTKEYTISSLKDIPRGYDVEGDTPYEKKIWERFWEYALNTERASEFGIKNAQIEAPGTMFVPGILYTIKIEHDGGLRIDSCPIAPILRGEKIP